MGVFIKVEIDMNRCLGIEGCGECVRVCPVSILGTNGNDPIVIEDNEDECILCDLCFKECTPEAISIRKIYKE
jgi:NAD-dependent dihydropyrimidine dehydrogenase PreA subunit